MTARANLDELPSSHARHRVPAAAADPNVDVEIRASRPNVPTYRVRLGWCLSLAWPSLLHTLFERLSPVTNDVISRPSPLPPPSIASCPRAQLATASPSCRM
jgi:hypothetical protein